MTDMLLQVNQVLSTFDESTEQYTEHDVLDAVNKLRRECEQEGIEPVQEIQAESMAFGFCENYQHGENGWGTYFGPMAVYKNDQGQWVEGPSIKRITQDIISYWKNRASQAIHPLLKARYADLVWDFSYITTQERAPYEMACIAIDSVIEIASKDIHRFSTDVITKLRRALSLARRLNIQSKTETVVDAIIAYEDKIAEDSKCGLWGFSFDLLVEDKNISLSDKQQKKIIDDLENRLKRVSDPENKSTFDPFASESAAVRLARHYRRLSNNEEIKRVLTHYGGAFQKASENASALLSMSWLEKVHNNYSQFNLKEDAGQIAIELKNLGAKCKGEMKPISHEFTIPKDEMEKYVNAMTEGDIKTALDRITRKYIPNRKREEKEVEKLSQEFVVQSIMPIQLHDHEGRFRASVGPFHEDPDGHLILHISQDLQVSDFYMRKVMQGFFSKFNPSAETILDHIYQSPVFNEDKRTIISEGLKAYVEGNSIIAVHLLIPQIEDALRNLAGMTGSAIYKPGRVGGFFLKTMDEILHESRVVETLGEDIILYLRVLFTDPRGLNLRNSVCHGICPSDLFSPSTADRVFHSLLVLSLLRESEGGEREN